MKSTQREENKQDSEPVFGKGFDDIPDIEDVQESKENKEEEEEEVLDDDEEEPIVETRDPDTKPAETPHVSVYVGGEKQQTQPRRGRPRRESIQAVDEISPDDVDQLIESFGIGDSERFITLQRIEPKVWMGTSIEGYLDKFESGITLEEVKHKYGGGKYEIMIHCPRKMKDGSTRGHRILTRKRFRISGNPFEPQDIGPNRRKELQEPMDPTITQQVLGHTQELIKVSQQDKRAAEQKSDRFLEKLMDVQKSGNGDGFEKVMPLLQNILEQQKMQLENSREETRRAIERADNAERRHLEEMMQLRKEMEARGEKTVTPLMEMMKESSRESMQRLESQIKLMATMSESNMKMLQQNNEMQMKIVQEGSRMQVDLLTKELSRVSDELKDTRIHNRGDLSSELAKYAKIKKIFELEGGTQGEQSLADRIIDGLPAIFEKGPEIGAMFNHLFGKGTPVTRQPQLPAPQAKPAPAQQAPAQQAPVQHAPAQKKPASSVHRPTPQPTQQETQETQATMENMASQIVALKSIFEKAIESGIEPEKFTTENIIGRFDEEALVKVASFPSQAVVQYIQQYVEEDSVLNTVRGRDFMRGVHNTLKNKYSKE